jgi:GT2 family glycosyltransferase
MEPNYLEEMLKAFEDKSVGAATGKLYKISEAGIMNYELWKKDNSNQIKILDTTGVNISKSGRARDRGQHEVDRGQYDASILVNAVSGAGCMYRRAALEQVKLPRLGTNNLALSTNYEYFDEDFHSYWEDVDLSWRMINNGWKNVFVPRAIAYHGRAAGSSPGGYAKFFSFVRHHSQIPGRIRELNYKNHIFMYIKNSPWFYPQFFVREFFMLLYILVFETRTLKVLPEVIKGIAKMWQKRRFYAKQSMPIKPTQN